MRIRYDTTARDVVIELLKRVFKWNKSWENVGLEDVKQTGTNSPGVFEDFFREPEQYPVVYVQEGGGQADKQDIRDFVGTAVFRYPSVGKYDTIDFYQTVGVSGSLFVNQAWQVWVPQEVNYIQEVEVSLAWAGSGLNDDIAVALVSGSLAGPTLASGSIPGFSQTWRSCKRVLLDVAVAVPSPVQVPYWVTLTTTPGSGYHVYGCAQSSVSGSAVASQINSGSWSIVQGAAYDGAVYDKSYYRIGGGESSTISITVVSKDMHSAEALSDLVQFYLKLLKQAVLTRRGGTSGAPRPADGVIPNTIGDLASKGIYITDIKTGAVTTKPRGNDILFTRVVTASCYGAWWEDFEVDPLRGIDLSITVQT